MDIFDVVIVGASFSGLTLAHHLPKHLRVLVVDAKPSAGSSVESTGLITSKTREEFTSFFPIDRFITNPITSICVVAPNFSDYFVSKTEGAWIYQTDTKALIKELADTLPSHVTFLPATVFLGVDSPIKPTRVRLRSKGEAERVVGVRVLVGADGSHSKVAQEVDGLDRNRRFLFGYEQVFFGDVHLGPNPAETIYHYWFGEFSLGYGGWLSPTLVDGKKAFRIGLAKLEKDRGDAKTLMQTFTGRLVQDGVLTIEGEISEPGYVFGSLIPIGGTLRFVATDTTVLIGDAAGYCGAFAADGIKGSVISAKEVVPLIERALSGDRQALRELPRRIEKHGGLLSYYKRQQRYRWVWDLMKRNRTFRAMFEVIQAEKTSFLHQFCDSKDTRKSLAWVVLKVRHIPRLMRFSWCLLLDMCFPKRSLS